MVISERMEKIVIVEDEAKVVQQIFRLYIDGYGTRRIANTLNEQGYYNATGGEWLPSTIRGMLKNRKILWRSCSRNE